MKTVYRYVLAEMMPSFLLCACLLSSLLLVNQIFLLLDMVLTKKVPFLDITILYLSLLPRILSMTIPMSMMVGTLLAFGRLSSDMEVTAFKSSGVHLFRLIAPVLAMSVVLTGGMIYFNNTVLPRANLLCKETQFKILKKQANLAIREKVWIDKFSNYRFYIDHQEPDGSFANIKAFNYWSSQTPLQTTMAKTGTLVSDPNTYQVFFHLNNGVISWDNNNYSTYHQLYFDRYIIRLNFGNQLANLTDVKKDYEEMDLKEIAQAIPLEKDPGRHNYLKTEYQKRLALPFACLVLSWFCAPLGLWTKSKGFMGFVMGLALIFVYYLMFSLGQLLSNEGILNPVISLWGTNFILGASGFLIYYLMVTEHSAFRSQPSVSNRRPRRKEKKF